MTMRHLAPFMLIGLLSLPAAAALPDCVGVVRALNTQLQPTIRDVPALAATLAALTRSGRLPPHYLDKRAAREAGWRPGQRLDRVPGLEGRLIGGDRFGNREGRLPPGDWREADIDHDGGRRNAKRLVFEPRAAGRRFVTTDHYARFTEVPACR
jgi:hypothetical protein